MEIAAILATVLPAFLPVAIDAIKASISKLFGSVVTEPKTFAEQIEYEKLGIEKLKALAELDRPIGSPSQWVVDLRAASRYVAVGLILSAYVVYCFLPVTYQNAQTEGNLSQLAGSAMFFLIGDRVYIGLKAKR